MHRAVVDSITATQPFSAPAAAVLLAIGSLRGDATQAAAHQGTTTRRLRRGLQALSGHAPAAWRPLFVSCALAAPDPHFSPAGPSNLPRTLVALRGLLGIQHEQQQQRREEEGELEQPAKQPRTRASSAPQSIAAARGLDPVEVLPVDAMVSIFRFLGYRCVYTWSRSRGPVSGLVRSINPAHDSNPHINVYTGAWPRRLPSPTRGPTCSAAPSSTTPSGGPSSTSNSRVPGAGPTRAGTACLSGRRRPCSPRPRPRAHSTAKAPSGTHRFPCLFPSARRPMRRRRRRR